ncbi:MAG: DUF6713 family protein [bacterium]|nr:DUF6713 family protein [bacterium]
METAFLLTGLAALINHELDAIQQQEWRFFLGWTGLSDASAYRLFTAAHLPLMVGILAALPDARFQIGFDAFLILHAVAHFALRRHPAIHFNTGFSRLWIYGGAALGLVHLVLVHT